MQQEKVGIYIQGAGWGKWLKNSKSYGGFLAKQPNKTLVEGKQMIDPSRVIMY